MKKILSLILTICIIASVCTFMPLSTSAATSGACGDNLTYTLDDDGILTISGTGEMYNYSEIEPAPWKDDLNKIDEIVFENGVTSVGDYAFYPYFAGSIGLIVPESLKAIGNSVFIRKEQLSSSDFFSCVSYIKYRGSKEDFENITVGEGNTGLDGANKYYQKIKIPVCSEYTDDDGKKSGITWVLDTDGTLTVSGEGDIPFNKLAGLYVFDNYDYDYSYAVKKIVVEEGITGVRNFMDFENLEEVSLPSTIKRIEYSCFNGDVKLKSITIPDKTEIIGGYAFYGTGIESLQIPEGVKNINGNIVDNTPLYNNEENWENGALYIDNWLISTKEGLEGSFEVKLGTVGIAGYSIRNEMTFVIMPETVKYIGDNAFGDYKGNELSIPAGTFEIGFAFFFSDVKVVYIPKSVTYIDGDAFDYSSVTDIYYEGSEEDWNKIFTEIKSDYSEDLEAVIHYNTEAFAITAVCGEQQGGSVSGGRTSLNGSDVTLTATPDNGYKFSGWYNGDTLVSSNAAYTFKAESDISLVAKFSRKSTGGGGGGSSISTYTVKFDTNGGSSISSVKVDKNSTVAEPAAPTKDGFEFAGWYADEELTIKYDFDKKVTSGITLYAAWTASETAFIDVTDSDWFAENVKYVFNHGLMNGISRTEFAPNAKLTRAMLVTILYRAEGEPEASKSIPFADVASNMYYSAAVAWAAQNGIVSGISETEFDPEEYITREQIAAIIYRYAIFKGYSTREKTDISAYTDANEISEYAIEAMQYAVGNGLINGKTDATLNPKDNATRAEIAAILNRFIERSKYR